MPGSAQASIAPAVSLRTLFEAPGRPVWLVGVAVAVLGVVGFGLQELLLGRVRLAADDPGVLDNMRVAITHVVITAYLLTAYVYAQRTTEQSIGELVPLLDPRRVDPLLARSRGERAALAGSVVVGVLVFFYVSSRISPGEVSFLPTAWDPEEAWHRILGAAMSILTTRLFTLLVLESGRLSALAGAIRHIDLLSPDGISPFARQGLTYALLVIGVVSSFALFLVDLRYLRLVGLVLVATLVVAVVALLLPLRGIRARIIDAKRQELRWCRQQMQERRARLPDASHGSHGADSDAPRLDELLAWERRIQEVREWPLDAPTSRRFVLYLLLPLGSWAGGALVERGIDALLD